MDKSDRIYQYKISFTGNYIAAFILFVLLCELESNSTKFHVLRILFFTFGKTDISSLQ